MSELADILIVDDTPSSLRLLVVLLSSWGYKVRPVASGAHALQAAWKQPPDLILLDINMPEMNGYEVCECLKANAVLKDIPIIFMSGMTESQDKLRAFKAGGVDYITKPFQEEKIRACIKVNLDLLQQKQTLLNQPEQQQPDISEKAERRLRVLVAEDNPVNQEVVRIFLSKRGHEVTIVSDGKQAVSAAASGDFDVILMDIQMPVMDGVEATLAIRKAEAEHGHYTPIVALTAYSMEHDKQRCLAAGMNRFISKPVTKSVLLNTVESMAVEKTVRN